MDVDRSILIINIYQEMRYQVHCLYTFMEITSTLL